MYKSFQEMPIWKESIKLSESIFKLSLNLQNQKIMVLHRKFEGLQTVYQLI